MKVVSLLKVVARAQPDGDPLLTDEERDYYAAACEQSGFTNPINWYRNWTRNWEAMEGVDQ